MEEIVGQIIDTVAKVGGLGSILAMIFLLMWYLERTDRRAAEKALVELTRETVGAIKDTGSAIERTGEHGGEIRDSTRRIAEAVTILTARQRR